MKVNGLDQFYYYLVESPVEFRMKTLLEVKKVIQKGLDLGHRVLVFNMSMCTFVDSSVVALLANLNKKLIEMGGKVALLKPSKDINDLLEVSNLRDAITVYGGNEELEDDLRDEKRIKTIERAKAEIDKKGKTWKR